ncbi:PTS sugar transporter subunit IIA [Shinella sp. CPCC 101442]|uniref:PTS sugar transporter subunit IIA n=1 Tax=Shinella sp. CPCC 101442 TaxID=2932265 RepID=UPI0021524598|nr:PTS sugar transporter subunit IIA [Shinella sp. CPCC 101442]MCR6498153.1 PTS sugar transporter subunit IIA [Shinella sp. CPCC 101442]
MQLSDHLALENVVVDLSSVSKHKLLQQLADTASRQTGIGAGILAKALSARESLGSTGIGRGIAIPHALVEGLPKTLAIVARLARPIDFEAVDDIPVDIVVLLLSPAAGQNLNILSCFARQLRDDATVHAIRAARSPEEIFVLLTRP